MPKLTEATMAKRRAHIIEATMVCFLKRGFAGTSIDDVCAEGGISKGAFYSHFSSKEDLIRAVLAARSGELGRVIEGETVEAVARSIHEQCMAPAMTPATSRFGLELMAAAVSDGYLRDAVLADLAAARVGFEAALRRLVASGQSTGDVDVAAAGRLFERHLLGVLCRNAIAPEEDEAEVVSSLEALLGSLLAGR